MKDNRDPKELGANLLHPGLRASVTKQVGYGAKLHHVYDYAEKHIPTSVEVADYAPDESTVQSTMAQYKDEMTAQAAQGDTAARIVCAEHAWAYGNACHVSNGRERRADVELEDHALPVRQCKKDYAHMPHTYVVVAQPGVRAPVEAYRCIGRV